MYVEVWYEWYVNTMRVVLLILCFQASASALEISEIQNKLFESSVRVYLGDSSKGATGFFMTPEKYANQVIVTCFHCATKKEIIETAYQSQKINLPKIMVQRLNDSQIFETKILAYHAKADLLFLQSPFSEEQDQLELEKVNPEVGDAVYGMKYDWRAENSNLSFMQSRVVAVRNDHGTGYPSHIYHRGQAMLIGFSGSALVNDEARVVGVNFFSFNPYFNLSEHKDVFRFVKWLKKPSSLSEFFSSEFKFSEFSMNDAFFEFAQYSDPLFGYDINSIYYANQSIGGRAFVAFSYSDFVYSWLGQVMEAMDVSGDAKVKSKILCDKLFASADSARLLFEKRLNITSAKASLACSYAKARLKYENKIMGKEILDDERKTVANLCTTYIQYLEQDKDNLDRMHLAGEISLDSTQFLQKMRTEIREFR